jgi:hypothetical protein
MVSRAVDLGDVPAGAVDPGDLVDDSLVGVFEDEVVGGSSVPPFRELRGRMVSLLSTRIEEQRERAGDWELDGPGRGAPLRGEP